MANQSSPYLEELKSEVSKLDGSEFAHSTRLLAEELKRVETGDKYKYVNMIDLSTDRPCSCGVKVRIPIKEFPKFNFVGKLLGPKGNTLKRLQEETGCKLSILGRGSMRDKNKEEELRKEGGKYAHLHEELHVMVECFADPTEGYSRLSHAVNELKKFMVPDAQDEIAMQQMQEMMYLNGGEGKRGRGRGAPGGPPSLMGGRGGGLLSTPGGRGGARGGMGGQADRGRGTPNRGGNLGGRGTPRGGRGSMAPRGRGASAAAPPPQHRAEPAYDDYNTGGYEEPSYQDSYDAGYGADPYDDNNYGGGRQGGSSGGGYREESGDGDTQYFDYGHGTQSYDDYGNQSSGGNYGSNTMKAPVRGGGRGGQYRSHPYSAGPGARGNNY